MWRHGSAVSVSARMRRAPPRQRQTVMPSIRRGGHVPTRLKVHTRRRARTVTFMPFSASIAARCSATATRRTAPRPSETRADQLDHLTPELRRVRTFAGSPCAPSSVVATDGRSRRARLKVPKRRDRPPSDQHFGHPSADVGKLDPQMLLLPKAATAAGAAACHRKSACRERSGEAVRNGPPAPSRTRARRPDRDHSSPASWPSRSS